MPQLATFGAKVPVTVVTGFLGSGKSTLLNYILANKGEKNICVIENEFGEVNIDKTLVGDKLQEQEDLVSLDNGCVCCSLRKDIVKAFSKLETRSKERKRPIDHILLETTGLADPSPVAFTFFANAWIAARFKLDSITCVVDAKYLMQVRLHVYRLNPPAVVLRDFRLMKLTPILQLAPYTTQHLEDQRPDGTINEAINQIAFADLILLNKTDLVDEAGKRDVIAAIKKINNTARIVESQLKNEGGRPALDDVLGTNTFSVQRCLTVDPQFLDSDSDCETEMAATSAQPVNEPSSHVCDHGTLDDERRAVVGEKREREAEPCSCHPDQVREKKPRRFRKKLHDLSDVSSVGITARGQLDEYRFNMFMRDLLTEKAKDIFRCKGVLSVHGYGMKKFVFQGVHETICYGPAEKPWQESEPRVNQIVFIGRGLDRKMLLEGFRTCIYMPLPEGWESALDESTHKPFFFNPKTGEKTWQRPESAACAHVTSHHATTQQPRGVAPSRTRTSSATLPSPTHSGNNAPAVAVA